MLLLWIRQYVYKYIHILASDLADRIQGSTTILKNHGNAGTS